MVKRNSLMGAAAAAVLASALTFGLHSQALAFGYAKFVEDPVAGFVGPIPTSAPAITVASDGEAPFDPFGAGFDTSDGIELNAGWTPDPAYAAAFAAGNWTQLPGTSTWVLPACIAGICENGPVPELIAKWDFLGGAWAPGTLGLLLYDSDGSFSDQITVANDGPNGTATITFKSDGAVPEPSAWVMMLSGIGAIGASLRMARRKAGVSATVA